MASHHPRRGAGLPGAVALGLLAAFWTATAVAPRRVGEPRRLEAQLRSLFEDNAPGIRALAVPTNGLLHLFGESRGAPDVAVARSSRFGPVLLFRPELAFERALTPRESATWEAGLAAVRDRIRVLREAGAHRVLLVPVPVKGAVLLAADPGLGRQVAAEMPRPDRPASRASLVASEAARHATGEDWRLDGSRTAARYADLVRRATAAGGQVVDLHDTFVRQAGDARDPVFEPEDTHWTSRGLALAAAATLGTWRGEAPSPAATGDAEEDRPGDLQEMLALPDAPRFRTHPFAEPRYDLPQADPPGRCRRTVFLLGTSYSRHGAGLASLVSRGSGCPVVDLAVHGRGALASFGPLLAGHREALSGAIVIWEFPFRDLLDPRGFVERP